MNRTSVKLFSATILAVLSASLSPHLAAGPFENEIPLGSMERIVVLTGGRIMPLDTFARISLMQLSGRRSYDGKPALDWFARLIFEPESSIDDRVFLVNHPGVFDALGLEEADRDRYSFRTLMPGLGRLQELVNGLNEREEGEVDALEADLVRTSRSIAFYSQLFGVLDYARPHADFSIEGQVLAGVLGLEKPGELSFVDVIEKRPILENPPSELGFTETVRLYQMNEQIEEWVLGKGNLPFKLIPARSEPGWVDPSRALLLEGEASSLSYVLRNALAAWEAGDADLWSRELRSFVQGVKDRAKELGLYRDPGLELFYNNVRPFFASAALALIGLIVYLISMALPKLRVAVPALLGSAASVQTAGLILRIVITGRPPVTSLYTSFLFVAWAVFLFGLFLHLRGRGELGLPVGLIGGFLMILLSSKFVAEGDNLGVLQAVLDTNFWLSTHVVTVTLGYAGCIVAGLVGHIYLLRKCFRPWTEDRLSATYRLLYGLLLYSLIFTFIGTILGGIWADQSWGRFWGWDPKENGAMLIVLWVSILLHAKLANMIDHQGMAAGSILLVLVVMFSWLGVNLMGVGLHSYGWTSGLGIILIIVAEVELLFLLVTLIFIRLKAKPTLELRKCRVKKVVPETPDTVTLRLATAREEKISYTPGMYLTVHARIDGITYRRPYSFSSIPNGGSEFDITIKRVEGGIVSNWIVNNVRSGQKLTVSAPSGDFRLYGNGESTGSESRDESSKVQGNGHVSPVFVAAGSGIGPLVAMAEEHLTGGGEELLLLYGSRSEGDIIFKERIDALRANHSGFEVKHFLVEPPVDWNGGRGRMTGTAVLESVGDLEGRRFYLCGPEGMVEEVRTSLLEAGIDEELIQEERFIPGVNGDARKASRGGLVHFASSKRSVKVQTGQPILEAALREGLPVRYSCTTGQCRECVARLSRGTVVMEKPNVLTKAEREKGAILTCVSYPQGDAEIDL